MHILFHHFCYYWSIASFSSTLFVGENILLNIFTVSVLVLNLVEYIEEEQKSRHAESIERRIAAGVSDVHRPSVVLPPAHYCRYCNKQCNSVSQYAEHCRSKDHIFKVTADQEHEWKFRIPPAGGHFDLCLE